MIIVRYADDLIAGFEHEADARRFWDALRERLQEFSLSLHPEKTRLIEFGRQAANNRKQRGLGKPETFNFLGMTCICGKSRGGRFLLKRRSRRDRMKAKIKEIAEELRWRMHQTIPEQGQWLRQVVTGCKRSIGRRSRYWRRQQQLGRAPYLDRPLSNQRPDPATATQTAPSSPEAAGARSAVNQLPKSVVR
jgi:hypothetical protein